MRTKTLLVLSVLFTALSAVAAFAGAEELFSLELRVTHVRYEDGGMREVFPYTAISATFSENGEVYGSAGCNRYSAFYLRDGDRVVMGPAASTRMFCSKPEGIMAQEAAFLRALENTAAVRVRDGQIELLNPAGETALILVEADSFVSEPPLIRVWIVKSLGGEDTLPDTEITITLTEDGKVFGRATVNNYFASWIEAGDLILFSGGGSTMMAGPEEYMKQESDFLDLLKRVRRYEVQDNELILTTFDDLQIIAVGAGQ